MTHEFSEEQLAAYLLGLADREDREAIAEAIPHDEELSARLAMLDQLLPRLPEKTSREVALEETVDHVEETAVPAGATPRYLRPLPEELQETAELHEQGLGPAEIAERLQATKTLVSLKLQKLTKFKS